MYVCVYYFQQSNNAQIHSAAVAPRVLWSWQETFSPSVVTRGCLDVFFNKNRQITPIYASITDHMMNR